VSSKTLDVTMPRAPSWSWRPDGPRDKDHARDFDVLVERGRWTLTLNPDGEPLRGVRRAFDFSGCATTGSGTGSGSRGDLMRWAWDCQESCVRGRLRHHA
jgi:hypothetical protein